MTDFSQAQSFDNKSPFKVYGTPGFIAPEMIND